MFLPNSPFKNYNSRYVQNKWITFLFFVCAKIPPQYAPKEPTFCKAYHLLMLMCVHVGMTGERKGNKDKKVLIKLAYV